MTTILENMCNKEKNVHSFIIDFLSWRKIEPEVIKHYSLGKKTADIYYQADYGISNCSIHTDKGQFDFEMGILNISDKEFLVTIYPERMIKNEKNKTMKKQIKRAGLQRIAI